MLREKLSGNLVTFETVKNRVIAKSKKYLGNENFKQIAEIIKEARDEYISADKESHFQVPRGEFPLALCQS